MPGYHGTKLAIPTEFNPIQKSRSKEVLYPRYYPAAMGKQQQHHPVNPTGHPMFEALRARNAYDRSEYARMMHRKISEPAYPTFDSLKLLGADNDVNYLEGFMSEGSSHTNSLHHPHHRLPHSRSANGDLDFRPRARSVSTNNTKNLPSKRNSVHADSLKKTILGSLKSAASDENIYESLEVINYRKTIDFIKKHNKLKSLPKTGHPLFDHLRAEKLLKGGQQNLYSDNSHSSSGSGDDEVEYIRKPNRRISRNEIMMGPQGELHEHKQKLKKKSQSHHKSSTHLAQHTEAPGSESDDDWAIPRPTFSGLERRTRRTGAPGGLMTQVSQEESDSSSKSACLR